MSYLNTFDYAVIACYFLVLLGLGFYLARKASASLEDYFLGGRQLPWWALGISGMASFLDITGTMLIVSFLFMLGPRGLFIEFRGGAVLILVITLIFAGKWHRRSNCITGAQWMIYRFGESAGGQFARVVTAITAMIGAVAAVAYLSKGVGLFLSMFLPFSPLTCAILLIGVAMIYTMASGFYGVVYTDIFQSGIILIAVITISTMAFLRVEQHPQTLAHLAEQITGSTQWTSAAPQWKTSMPEGYTQYSALMAFALFYLIKNLLGGVGCGADPKYFGARDERECGKLTFLWTCLMMCRWPMMMGFAILGLFLVHEKFPDRSVLKESEIAIKQYLLQEAAPDRPFDLQAHLAVERVLPRSKWDTTIPDVLAAPAQYPSLVAGFRSALGTGWTRTLERVRRENSEIQSTLLPKSRWDELVADIINHPGRHAPIVTTIRRELGEEWPTKLKLLGYEGGINPERILPAVLLFDIPMGLRGLLLVALIAASMSTFDSGMNASAGFFTKDIYQRYWRPRASTREMMLATYVYILVVIVLGLALGNTSSSINDIWGWLTMGLGAGLLVPGMLKFFWWRFNSGGVIVGTLTGIFGAVVQRLLWPELDERLQFLYLTAVGLVGSVVGTYLSKPDDPKVLEYFYMTTRPFGVWGPLKRKLSPELRRLTTREHVNDILAIPFALIWQVSLFLFPMLLLIGNYRGFWGALGVFLLGLGGLYVFWFRNLPAPGVIGLQGLDVPESHTLPPVPEGIGDRPASPES